MKKTLLMFTLMAAVTSASAQPRPNNDGTVTFQYRNDSAKKVQVDVQFAGRKDMTRAADGTWTVTLGPVAPDMYPYCFIVDGVSVMDPENPQYFPNEGFKNSLVEIPSKDGSLPHDIRPVPHGRIEYVHYSILFRRCRHRNFKLRISPNPMSTMLLWLKSYALHGVENKPK